MKEPVRWVCPHGCRPDNDPARAVTHIDLFITPSAPPVHSCRKQNWRTVALVPEPPQEDQ